MAATMYALRFLVVLPLLKNTGLGAELQLGEGLFFISCLVLLSLAAAGNMINDYFDRKVDLINKPEKLIVGKEVKRRTAIMLHLALNILAVALTAVLVLASGRWSGLLFPLAIAAALWWYSPVLKKKPFIGNLTVALMVAAIPFWTVYFEIPLLRSAYSDMMHDPNPVFKEMWLWISAYSVFAFLLTLAREGVKDLEDLRGDTAGNYLTLPILWGKEKMIRYISALLLITTLLILSGAVWMFNPTEETNRRIFIMALILVTLPLLICLSTLRKATQSTHFTRSSFWLKVTMAGGLIFLVFAREWILSAA